MSRQPRQVAGSRRAGVSEGGRYTTKPVPDVVDTELGFNNQPGCPSGDWTERKVKLWGLTTTFTRTVNDDGTATVAASCGPSDMVLLAKKGDHAYWVGKTWCKDNKTRRIWAAGIAAEMLNEGFVGVGDGDAGDGIRTAMNAASSPQKRDPSYWQPDVRYRDGTTSTTKVSYGPHTLTGVVAQIRGLRLLQSMAPVDGGSLTFGGGQLRSGAERVLLRCFEDAAVMYVHLRRGFQIEGPPWGPQPATGYVSTGRREEVFVGEQGDLLWRALTETDLHGRSPLKETLMWKLGVRNGSHREVIVAAMLHDETAAEQLTTGLFDSVDSGLYRSELKAKVLTVLNDALNPSPGECLWTAEQQDRLRGFIETVEALEPVAGG